MTSIRKIGGFLIRDRNPWRTGLLGPYDMEQRVRMAALGGDRSALARQGG
jgi:hypothetical protein